MTINQIKDSKKLCEMYEIFYKEKCDVTSQNFNFKVQTMLVILNFKNITLNNNITFEQKEEAVIPTSSYITYLVNELAKSDKTIINNEETILTDTKHFDIIKQIDNLGKTIRWYKNSGIDEISILTIMSNLVYKNSFNNQESTKKEFICPIVDESSTFMDQRLKKLSLRRI